MNKKTASRRQNGESFMKYSHIVFDVDGTLLDTAQCILISLQDALQKTDSISREYDDLVFALGYTSLAVLDRLQVKDPQATLKLWVENENKYSDMIRLFDGIRELLEQLKKDGCELGIVTSRTREEFDLIFRHQSISDMFSTIICASDTDEHKPSPAPLLKYMELTGATGEEMLYVGDSPGDEKCASGADVDFALAMWGVHTDSIPAKYLPRTPQELYKEITK